MEKETPNTIRVYKYHKFNMHLIELLVKYAFHCSNRKQLNDPYDLNMLVTKEFIKEILNGKQFLHINPEKLYLQYCELRGNHPSGNGTTEDKINRIYDNVIDENVFKDLLFDIFDFKIVSFCGETDPQKDILMWAHYAGFDGVRLTFEFPKIVRFKEYYNPNLEKVKYTKYPPLVNCESDIKKSLLVKHNQWEYENEYRIVTQKSDKIGFHPDCLHAIAFGNRMNYRNFQLLIRLLNEFRYRNCALNFLRITPDFSYESISTEFYYDTVDNYHDEQRPLNTYF